MELYTTGYVIRCGDFYFVDNDDWHLVDCIEDADVYDSASIAVRAFCAADEEYGICHTHELSILEIRFRAPKTIEIEPGSIRTV